MSHAAMPDAIMSLPCGAVGRRLARVRACLRHLRLDAALSRGADPWSTGELMARAAQLGSLRHRRKVKAKLVAVVKLAEYHRSGSSYLVWHRVVLEQRESLLALAERLGQLEPVEVAVAAQLSLLVSDPASPVYAGASDPGGLSKVTARCLDRVVHGS
jgi:hypothetical protein